MGGLLARIVFKNGEEHLPIAPEDQIKSLWDYTVTDVDN
jgi:hypothetical protein